MKNGMKMTRENFADSDDAHTFLKWRDHNKML